MNSNDIKRKTNILIFFQELANQLIAMYIASGEYETAEEIFNQVKEPNVQNYVGLMNYFNQLRNWERTLQLYDQMKLQRRIQLDVATYLTVLLAIKETSNIDKAKQIEQDLLKQNLWHNHVEIQKILKEILKTPDD